MATKRQGVHDNLELHFVLMPFKIIYLSFLLGLMFVTISLGSLYCFCNDIELTNMLHLYFQSRFDNSNMHQITASYFFRSVDWLVFDLTKIRDALIYSYPSDSFWFKYQLFLKQHTEGLNHFVLAAKVLSFRAGIVATYIVFLAPLLFFVAAFDGLSQRAIRRDNIGRESAGIYHRVKYWNRGITILLILVLLATPVYISAQWYIPSVVLWAILAQTTFKFYKKYI